MNEHDEYLRTRTDHNPVAVRWVIVGLVLFWAAIAWVAG